MKLRFPKTAAIAGLAVALLGSAALAQIKVIEKFQPDAEAAKLTAERLAVLGNWTPVTDAMLKSPSPNDWLMWRRTFDAHGSSPLTQINKSNVAGLVPAWTWSLPDGTAEFAPLVHDGIMFVWGTTDHLQAFNAKNGDLLWEYVRPPMKGPAWNGIAGSSRRNIAVYGDRLFFPTFDGHEVALDVKSGKVVWDHPVSDIDLPYRASAGPTIVNGKLIQGFTNCSRLQPGGCILIALDINDGHELWRLHTMPKPGEPGDETWKGVPYEQRQGASMWTTPSYDPDLNLLFVGTGNTYAWQYMVHGDTKRDPSKSGLYINSTLAVNPDTGKLVWYFQHLPQDTWNSDFAFERPVVTINWKGKPTKVVCATGKSVWTDCLDAKTGQWLFDHDEGLQNIIKSVDAKGNKTYFDNVLMDLTQKRSSFVCVQMKNWPASAVDEASKMLYIVIVTTGCSEEIPHVYAANEPYSGGEMSNAAARYNPKTPGITGRLDAINLETNQLVWSKSYRVNMASSALATAGGLVFAGDTDRWFRAYDSSNGNELWNIRLNHTPNSTPITYSVDGKQYVAIIAGKGQGGHGLTPEVQWPKNDGSVLWVFALPDKK